MTRPKRYLMRLPGRELVLGDRTLIMGIINVTPDSFSDGGTFLDPGRALTQALKLQDKGADIIDIGAESTRPGADRISEEEELRRLLPVLEKLQGRLEIPVSVDTYKSAVAEQAIAHGVEIINDPTNLTFDPEIAKVAAQHDVGLILNHMRGTPETWAKLGMMPHPMLNVIEDLEASISRARRAGVDKTRIIVDPGLGFGKRGEQNFELIARLWEMKKLDQPILIGPSRKSFLAHEKPMDADRATTAAVTAGILHGAHIVRVHDVAAIGPVVKTADSILRSIPEETQVEKPVKAPVNPKRVEFAKKKEDSEEGPKPIRPNVPARRLASERPPLPDSFKPRSEGAEDVPPRAPRRAYGEDRGDRGDRPPRRSYDSPREDRPAFKKPYRRAADERGERDDRPARAPRTGFGSKSFGDKPFRAKPTGDRPFGEKSYGDKPYRARPEGDKSFGDKPFGGKSYGDRPYRAKPEGDKPFGAKRAGGAKSFGDKPFGGKSYGDKPYRAKPEGDRPFGAKRAGGARSFGDKPFGAKRAGGKPFKKATGAGARKGPVRPKRRD